MSACTPYGMNKPSKASVFRLIQNACDRFGFVFEKPSRRIADAVMAADYDALAELAFLGMGDGLDEEYFRERCAALGLE